MKSNRFWIVLLAAVLGLSLLSSFLVLRGRGGTVATVRQDRVLLRTIDLSAVDAPYTFDLSGPAGTNTVEVQRGRIRVAHADCPDQICVHQGWISDSLFPIVCLPNGLVIEITGGRAPDIDGVAG